MAMNVKKLWVSVVITLVICACGWCKKEVGAIMAAELKQEQGEEPWPYGARAEESESKMKCLSLYNIPLSRTVGVDSEADIS